MISVVDVTPALLPMRPAEERLLSSLFRDYDVDARGSRWADTTININIQLLLRKIHNLVNPLDYLKLLILLLRFLLIM